MHLPRPPALSPGVTSFLWGLGLGLFVWLGLLSIGVSRGTALLAGVVAGAAIFFYVRLYGDDPLRP